MSLYDRGTPGVDERHFVDRDIATDHIVTHVCETCGSNTADVTKSENTNIHISVLSEIQKTTNGALCANPFTA